MNDRKTDTIAAISTPPGGAIAVIRLSGSQAEPIAMASWRSSRSLPEQQARKLCLGEFIDADQQAIDRGLAVRFPAPLSYTGEDMVELHCHGGGLAVRAVLSRLLNSGARAAKPGEFTRRAFLNGKLDLTQAEAVADLIDAHSEMALRVGKRQLDGLLGRRISSVYDQLYTVLSDIESQLDFPDEDIERTPGIELNAIIDEAGEELRRLEASRLEGEVLRHGARLVLAGAPNVGKSSLMNAVLGRDRAIVTHIPGTTRDTLEEFAHIRGIPARLVDTAGIREAKDAVESAGIERTINSMKESRLIIWITDATQREKEGRGLPADFQGYPLLRVMNKWDQMESDSEIEPEDLQGAIRVSAKTGYGLEELFDAIEGKIWKRPHHREPEVAVSARHAALLAAARPLLEEAGERLAENQLELAATALREAVETLGGIHGKTVVPDVLESIFSRFCIGK